MRLRDKISMPRRPVVVYEILPPRIIDGTSEDYAERISTLLSKTHIDAINIPEVHPEETRGKRPVGEKERAEPRQFGKIIQDSIGIEAIINRVTVHNSVSDQNDWFRSTKEEFGIDNLVLVGGESGKISYPGPSVTESAISIQSMNKIENLDIFCGGISLPSRKVESKRMLSKAESGIDFFTTQVLYESSEICKMLAHYHEICKISGVVPKRTLLSFAPISTVKNLRFLKWLGVEIPKGTEEKLIQREDEMKSRSIEISMKILEDILNHILENKITVPIGLNVEHIMAYNFDHSVELLQLMSKRYRRFCIDSDYTNCTG